MQTTKLNQVTKQVVIEMFNMFENDDINLNQIETNLAIPLHIQNKMLASYTM